MIQVEGEAAQCESCKHTFSRRVGIWRFLPASRENEFAEFLRDYQVIRADEGWGAPHADYYRALPCVAEDNPRRDAWRIHAKSFRRLLEFIGNTTPLRILDVGAGNGWLSNQLTLRGHITVAVDLSDDVRDGLGAWVHYTTRFECYQAEFDRLPFRDTQFDLVVFNSTLHYSVALAVTLREAHRVLLPGGKIVVLDSPFYSGSSSGEAMVKEREASFALKFGFQRQVHTVGFLTTARLRCAATEAGLTVWVWAADDDWHKKLRRAWTWYRMGREPARFPMVVLERAKW